MSGPTRRHLAIAAQGERPAGSVPASASLSGKALGLGTAVGTAERTAVESSGAQLTAAEAHESVTAGSVTADSVTAGSVTAGSVAAGSITASSVTNGDLLQVGDLAKATGKTVRAIHLYEDLGLLEPVRRSKGRYRLFAPEAKVRIRWISKLQSLGLSLTEIQAIAQRRQASESARLAAQELGVVYRAKLDEVRATIREYRALETELEASLHFLETCSTRCESELRTVCCSQCTHHADVSHNAPDLVLGAHVE